MKREILIRDIVLMAVTAALLVLALGATARPQQDSGPNPGVGETVLVPKKTPPPTSNTTSQSTQQKPEKIDPNEIYTLTTSTNLINVDVLVVDNNGNPIVGLKKGNFKLTDEGVPQSITNFATGDAPMTVCLLIEYSNKYWGLLYRAERLGGRCHL